MNKPLLTALLLFIYSACCAQTQFFVSTLSGGVNQIGAFFTGNSDGSNFHLAYSCDTTGSRPVGNMLQAANGLIYGVTETGGYHDSCVIYTYDPNTGQFTNIHDFALNEELGAGARSGFIPVPDGLFYGTAPVGGDSAGGVIYTVNPNNNQYTLVHNFIHAEGFQVNTGLTHHTNGKLYGMANSGGLYDYGTIYSYDPANGNFQVLHNFDLTSGYISGGRLVEVTGNRLLGTTTQGGQYSAGLLFSINVQNDSFTVLKDFYPAIGTSPMGDLLMANNGKVYGTTFDDGTYGGGTIFEVDPATGADTVVYNFSAIDGTSPDYGLTQASDGMLYGITHSGGAFGYGTIYRYNIITHLITKLYDFEIFSGVEPSGPVCEATLNLTSISPSGFNIPAASFSLSPNPATNTVTITVDESMVGSTATLTDLTGRSVETVLLSTASRELSTDNLENGIYLVSVTGAGGRVGTKKLVISK